METQHFKLIDNSYQPNLIHFFKHQLGKGVEVVDNKKGCKINFNNSNKEFYQKLAEQYDNLKVENISPVEFNKAYDNALNRLIGRIQDLDLKEYKITNNPKIIK